jgi:hypothetical protein
MVSISISIRMPGKITWAVFVLLQNMGVKYPDSKCCIADSSIY